MSSMCGNIVEILQKCLMLWMWVIGLLIVIYVWCMWVNARKIPYTFYMLWMRTTNIKYWHEGVIKIRVSQNVYKHIFSIYIYIYIFKKKSILFFCFIFSTCFIFSLFFTFSEKNKKKKTFAHTYNIVTSVCFNIWTFNDNLYLTSIYKIVFGDGSVGGGKCDEKCNENVKEMGIYQ